MAQKVIQRSFDAQGVEKLEITGDQVFLIKVEASDTDIIEIRTEVEGENYENVVLSVNEHNGTLQITTGYTPYFEAANDKLAAHKVISIEMTVRLPEQLSVYISSFLASVEASGTFQNLYMGLNNGNCTVTEFLGNAEIYTRQGFIWVFANPQVSGEGNSIRGRVVNKLPKDGSYKIQAQSVNGEVILNSTQ